MTNAQISLDKTSSSSSLAKQQAEQGLYQAANAVRDAQDALTAAATINVPRHGQQNILNPDGSFNSNATQTQINTYNSALRAEQDAEGNMQKAQLSLDDAKKQEAESVAAAQATLDDAKQQLALVQSGSTAADLAAAQASLDQAQNSLATLQAPPAQADIVAAQTTLVQAQNSLKKLQAPPLQTDLVQAQAAVDTAKNNLAKLKAPPLQTDLVQAQAAVDQAKANLATVMAGSTDADIAAAQSTLDQAVNNLKTLQAGPLATDVEQGQASVDQAKASLASAQMKLDEATLTAPFAGVIADLPVTVGEIVGASTAIADLVDTSAYHVDMNVGESDISQVKVGQDVDLTFDALPGQVFTGTLTFVAPKATIASGVVSYLATATLDPKAASNSQIKPGMTTTASAIVAQATNVLLVPNRAIKAQGTQKVVYVLNGRQQIPVPIETGIANDQYTEVVNNQVLRENDQLVLTVTTTSAPAGGGFLFGGGGLRGGGR